MKCFSWFAILAAVALAAPALPQITPSKDKPTESEHRQGPNGLEGWTLNWTLPDPSPYGDEKFAFTLVLARNGHVIRKIEGDPIIWRWMFRADGQQVAYETGPLHFDMTCVLADIKSGRALSSYDCYHELPADAPEWVKTLESTP